MSLTQHAMTRLQQRGIDPFAIELLERFGRETYDHNGAVILHFDKKARRQAERDLGRRVVRRNSELFHYYLVLSTSGDVLTAGKRYRKLNR